MKYCKITIINCKTTNIDSILQFLTPNAAEDVCLFGIHLHIAPNPNGITTQVPNCINLENVRGLINETSSPASDKYKQLLKIMEKSTAFAQCSASSTTFADQSNTKSQKVEIIELRNYIDGKFLQIEERLTERMLLMEKRQNEKFECLLKLLEKLQDS